MPSVIGHTILAVTAASLPKKESKQKFWVLLIICIISSCIPDTDVIAFKFGIPYGHMFGHRGFSHSIFFGLIWGGFMTMLYSLLFGKVKYGWLFVLFSLVTISHGVLDAVTTGGKGIGFFIPFINERYFLPWRFITVSPLSLERFFSSWGLKVLGSELLYLGIPCLLIFLVKMLFSKNR
jgi:inner membrane protein